MSQLLPDFPHLEHLKGQAKDVLRLMRHRKPGWNLTRAHHAVARGYGFVDWPDLKTNVESLRQRSPGISTSRRPITTGECPTCVAHPLVGVWSQPLHDGAMLAFNMSGNTITMTQVGIDAAGRDMAIKIAIRVDGSGPPVRFGQGFILEARVADSGSLETVIRNDERIVSEGAYNVSADGHTLTFVTSTQQIAFERM